jgi:hypothetical protein
MRIFLAVILAFMLSISAADASPLRCLSGPQVASVRESPSRLVDAFSECRAEIGSRLVNFSEDELKAAFAAVAAHASAPYGQSMAVRLADLLKEPDLDCDNYASLTGHFLNILLPGRHTFGMAGFDGGAVGNHAQVFITVDGQGIFADPTFGIIAKATFDHVLQGRSVEPVHIFEHNPNAVSATIISALRAGKYKPSDILYYYHSIDDYITYLESAAADWENPKHNVDKIVRPFPTPASGFLRRRFSD